MNRPITQTPAVFGNAPVLRGTRIRPLEVTDRFGAGESLDNIMEDLFLTREQVMDALHYRYANIKQRREMIWQN